MNLLQEMQAELESVKVELELLRSQQANANAEIKHLRQDRKELAKALAELVPIAVVGLMNPGINAEVLNAKAALAKERDQA